MNIAGSIVDIAFDRAYLQACQHCLWAAENLNKKEAIEFIKKLIDHKTEGAKNASL